MITLRFATYKPEHICCMHLFAQIIQWHLGTPSSLIKEDPDKAQHFVDDTSSVYHYLVAKQAKTV